MKVKDELLYTKEHVWINPEGDLVTMGISDYAQDSLGEIVYLEVSEVGAVVQAGSALGSIESVKAVSQLYCPVTGTVVEVNEVLEDDPEWINSNPYDEGWILKLKIDTEAVDREAFLTGPEYAKLTQET